MSPIEKFLSALTGHNCDPKPSGKGWSAKCPAHDDNNPSLSVAEGDGGIVLAKCFAGCPTKDIAAAVGLKERDLFLSKRSRLRSLVGRFVPKRKPAPKSQKQPAVSTEIPKSSGNGQLCRQPGNKKKKAYETLSQAISELHTFLLNKGYCTQAGSWGYRNENGEHVASVVRFDDLPSENEELRKTYRPVSKHPDGWRWGDPPGNWPLYRLMKVKESDRVLVCEGEKAAYSAEQIGMVATTSAHGSQSPHKTDWAPLAGKTVMILPDNDEAGAKYVDKVLPLLAQLDPQPTVFVGLLPELPEKGDLFDWVALHEGKLDEAAQYIEGLFANSDPVKLPESQTEKGKKEKPSPPPFVPFCTDQLPEPLRSYVAESAKALNCDESYIALTLMASAAAAIGNSRRIELKSSWQEPCVIWAVVVGESGTLKSPAFDLGTRHMQERQGRELKRFEEVLLIPAQPMSPSEVELSSFEE